MRKINTSKFQRATRGTPREINQSILLNLIRELQPISRAELARRMRIARGMVSSLVDDLLADGLIREGETARARRGRRPMMLYVRARDRFVVAVDVRFRRTTVMLSDLEGSEIAKEVFPTELDPERLVTELAERIDGRLKTSGITECEGIGLVVPGMVDRRSGLVLNSPPLGWRNVPLREMLARATGLPVLIENNAVAGALAQIWLRPAGEAAPENFVFVAVSDGVGAGIVMGGEVVRGPGQAAGEFGHVPLSLDGPRCMCGLQGCWEAYTSNIATRARYLGLEASMPENRDVLRETGFKMGDLVARARGGDAMATHALQETGRYLGIGLGGIITALGPARVLIGGEITAAWELIGDVVRREARARALTDPALETPIIPLESGLPRLRGAVALLVARRFAAPKVA